MKLLSRWSKRRSASAARHDHRLTNAVLETLENRRLLAWTQVYPGSYGTGDAVRGTNAQGVTYEWSPTKISEYPEYDEETGEEYYPEYVGGYRNETLTLTLGNLPAHAHAHAHGYFSAGGPPLTEGQAVPSVQGRLGGSAIPLTGDPTNQIYEWYIISEASGSRPAHSGSSLTAEFTGSGFPNGWEWGPSVIAVDVYQPWVWINGYQYAYEDGLISGGVWVYRDSPYEGQPADTDLLVKLQYAGQSGATTEDYTAPTYVTIPAGQDRVWVPIEPIQDTDDDDGEYVNVSIAPRADYVINPYSPGPQPVYVHDDDVPVAWSVDLSLQGVVDAEEATRGKWVQINWNRDEKNFSADGQLYGDNAPDAVAGDRIVAGDPELLPATLNFGGSVTGTYVLTFPDRIKVWRVNGSGSFTQIISGTASASISTPHTVDLRIEGLELSDAINDVNLEVTFTPSSGAAVTDRAKLTVGGLDLDIDSDNNNGFDRPTSLLPESAIEEDPSLPGKYLTVNDGDDDNDGVIDFADGYNRDGTASNADDVNYSERFVPLTLVPSRPLDLSVATFRLQYSGSHPAGVTGSGGTLTAGPGHLRLWRVDGNFGRRAADYFAPGTYTADQLGIMRGFRQLFYVEAVRPTTDLASRTIKVFCDPDGPTGPEGEQLYDLALVTAITGTAANFPPATPANPRLAVAGPTQVNLDWDDNSEAGVTYYVYRGTELGFPADESHRLPVTLTSSQFVDDTLPNPSTESLPQGWPAALSVTLTGLARPGPYTLLWNVDYAAYYWSDGPDWIHAQPDPEAGSLFLQGDIYIPDDMMASPSEMFTFDGGAFTAQGPYGYVLTAGRNYYYKLRAVTSAGQSGPTSALKADTLITPPAPEAPGGVTFDDVTPTSITIRWTDNSLGERGFRIERWNADTNAWDFVTETDPNVTSFTDSGLDPNTTYRYRVTAINSGGDSNGQETETDTENPEEPLPPPPSASEFTATAVSATQINLAWPALAPDVDEVIIERADRGYRVYYNNSEPKFEEVGRIRATAFQDKNLRAGTRYEYRIRMRTGGHLSDYSAVVFATTTLPAPTGLTVTSSTATQHNEQLTNLAWQHDLPQEQQHVSTHVEVLQPDGTWRSVWSYYNPFKEVTIATDPANPPQVRVRIRTLNYVDGRWAENYAEPSNVVSIPFRSAPPQGTPGLPYVFVSYNYVSESSAEGVPVTVSVSRTLEQDLILQLEAPGGTATEGVDYDAVPRGVRILAGDRHTTFMFKPKPDDDYEGDWASGNQWGWGWYGYGWDGEHAHFRIKPDPAKYHVYQHAYYYGSSSILEDDVDLDIDSDNDNGFYRPDSNAAEDTIESDPAKSGKIIAVNDDDSDGDGIPDFADGYNRSSTESKDNQSAGDRFVPLAIHLPWVTPHGQAIDASKATFKFTYNSSDPIANVTPPASADGEFELTGTGALRVWRKSGSESRDGRDVGAGGDFVKPNTIYTGEQLGLPRYWWTQYWQQPLYVEAVRPSAAMADQQIVMSVDLDGDGDKFDFTKFDTVRLTIAATVSIEASRPEAFEHLQSSGLSNQWRDLEFTVRRDGLLDSELTVHYVVGGTASPGSDYQDLTGTVTIPGGSESARITITPINDGLTEDEYESVDIRLIADSDHISPYVLASPPPAGKPTGRTAAATGVIADHPAAVDPEEIGGIVHPEFFYYTSGSSETGYVTYEYQFLQGKAYRSTEVLFTTREQFDAVAEEQANAGRVIDQDEYNRAVSFLDEGIPFRVKIASLTEDPVVTAAITNERNSVGAAGRWEALIPFWGSARSAVYDFQTGRWVWGIINTGLAISDVFLIKSIATAGVKALIKPPALTAAEVAARNAMIEQVAQNLSRMGAAERAVAEAAEVGASLSDDAARAAHKAERWAKYQSDAQAGRNADWNYERWSNVYDANQTRALRANQAADAYRQRVGLPDGQFTLDADGVPRRYDLGDKAAKKGIEHKTGYQTATSTGPSGVGGNLWEIERDIIMREKGWDIRWVFEGEASQPLLQALDDAGIPYSFATP